jgi:hypothetical protein
MWHPSVIEDLASPCASVHACSPSSAQVWCNFVVFTPHELHPCPEVMTETIRRECIPGRSPGMQLGRSPWSNANSCSFISTYRWRSAHFRVKQFLYDWAPAAADQPCLWGESVRVRSLDHPYVVWIGRDYKKRPGAYARMGRTSIELSVIDGQLHDDDVVALYCALKPANPNDAHEIMQTPFARLSYWARHGVELINVPFGLWEYRRKSRHERYHWTVRLEESNQGVLPKAVVRGWTLDGIGRFGEEANIETEWIWCAGADRGREVRIIVQRGRAGRISIPPILEKHPCETTMLHSAGIEVYWACVSGDFGPHNAVFEDHRSGLRALVLTSAAQEHDRAWFVDLLKSIDLN